MENTNPKLKTENEKTKNMQNRKIKTHNCQLQFGLLDVLYALQYPRKS